MTLSGQVIDMLHLTSTNATKILIVIPTFNNKSTLRRVIEDALGLGLDILVVNDGSTDGSVETVSDFPIQWLNFPVNRGKGAAIGAGAKWAIEHGYSHIITIDADGQHDPTDILKFIEKINKNPLSLIIGVRDFNMTDTPGSSVFGRKFSNFWIKISCGASVADSQSGFRAYPVALFRKVPVWAKRYNFEMEILVRAVWAGMAVEQIGISVHYTEQTTRASHFRPFLDNLRISLTFSHLVVRNLFPWPHKNHFGQSPREEFKQYLFHPIKTIKLLLTEQTTPRQIAMATMLGIFMGTLPLIAMHIVAIIFVATRLKLNRLIAVNVSHLCAPPFVPAMAIELGYFIRHGRFLTEFTMQTLGNEALQRLWDYLLGAILLAPMLATAAGAFAYGLAILFQKMQKNFAS